MTYDEFKNFLVTYLWKDGDQVLIDNLDNLVRMANASLRADLRLRDQLITDAFGLETSQASLDRVRYVRSVVSDTDGEFKWVEPNQLEHIRTVYPDQVSPVYSIYDNAVHFSGPFQQLFLDGSPYIITLIGYQDIPNLYDVVGGGNITSWLTESYLDLYVYAVLQHAAGFLREDERVAQWKQLYDDAVRRAMDNDQMFGQRGKTTPLPLPYPASPIRRRNWRHNL